MHPFGRAQNKASADIYRLKNVPVSCCEIFRSQTAAIAVAHGDIRLLQDPGTGLISNADFDSQTQQFSESYNGSQHGSAHFGRYAADLAERLARCHALAGKHIVEIGCGEGTFLKGLCEISGARGTGIDPSLPKSGSSDGEVQFLSERVGQQHYGLKPDLIICRHTLEHILQLEEILLHVSELMQGRDDIPLYVDVPDTTRIADEGAFWDVYYEHCHYFTADSLRACLQKFGFQVEELHSEFNGQYLCATAYLRSASAAVVPSEEQTVLCKRLSDNLIGQRKMWQDWIDGQPARSVVLWGSGSKAVAFLSSLRLDNQVAAVVDINRDKQNSFLAGTGHPVVSPQHLAELEPKRIVIMNPVYETEIREVLSDLSITADIVMPGVTQFQLNDMSAV